MRRARAAWASRAARRGPGQRPTGCFFAPRCTSRCDDVPRRRSRRGSRSRTATRCAATATRRSLAAARARAHHARATAPQIAETPTALLSVDDLSASYGAAAGRSSTSTCAVEPRECVALVGESGSGKTTLARCIAGLHRDSTGEILLQRRSRSRRARGRAAARVAPADPVRLPEPVRSLNPRKTIGQIVGQPLQRFFEQLRGERADERVVDALERVSLGASVIDRYPDELSGGERQRVAIARALAAEPALLVCDEITSALDVSVQAAIVDLIAELQRDLGLGLAVRDAQPRPDPHDREARRGDEPGPHRRARARAPGARRADRRLHAPAAGRHADARGRRRQLTRRGGRYAVMIPRTVALTTSGRCPKADPWPRPFEQVEVAVRGELGDLAHPLRRRLHVLRERDRVDRHARSAGSSSRRVVVEACLPLRGQHGPVAVPRSRPREAAAARSHSSSSPSTSAG